MLAFFELLYDKKCIWDVNSNEYKLKHKKAEAFKDIATQLNPMLPGINADIVRKKVNSIRTQFRTELKKVADNCYIIKIDHLF